MLIKIYPDNPNSREIDKVVSVLSDGGTIIYPTDTLYAIGCDALNVRAVEKYVLSKASIRKKQPFDYLQRFKLNQRICQSRYTYFQADEAQSSRAVYVYFADNIIPTENLQKQKNRRYSRP